MNPIIFFVEGSPKAQPRPRAFAMKIGGKFQARVYESGTAESWKSLIAVAAKPFLPVTPYEGPICLNLIFFMPRPRSHFGTGKNLHQMKPTSPSYYVSKPDRDNLDKAVCDCLTQIGMWKDDSQVCDGYIRKLYTDEHRQRPGVIVEIGLIEPQQLKI